MAYPWGIAASFIIGVMGKSMIASLRKHEIGALNLYSLTVTRCRSLHLKALSEVKIKDWAAMYFGVVNIGSAFLYYSSIYIPRKGHSSHRGLKA